MNKVVLWIVGIFLPMGLLFVGIAGWIWLEDQAIAENGLRGRGTVIELARSRNSDGDVTYRPIVEFFDSNRTRHEFTGQVGSSPPQN